MAEIESVVKPDGIADNFRGKAVTFVGIHELTCQYLSVASGEQGNKGIRE